MLITKAARRYAKALLELAKERNEVEPVLEDINFIDNTLKDSRELTLFLRSPVINYDDKQAVLEKLFSDHMQEVTALFLKLLVRKNRINILAQITEAFIDSYNTYAGIIKIKALAAYKLSTQQRTELQQKLEEKTGQKVDLNVEIDKSLMGGMSVRIEDTVIDGTVKNQLQELEEQLLTTA